MSTKLSEQEKELLVNYHEARRHAIEVHKEYQEVKDFINRIFFRDEEFSYAKNVFSLMPETALVDTTAKEQYSKQVFEWPDGERIYGLLVKKNIAEDKLKKLKDQMEETDLTIGWR